MSEIPIELPYPPTLHVNRLVKPEYSWEMEKIIHPELENNGPEVFSLYSLEKLVYQIKSDKYFKAKEIYLRLKDENKLKDSFSLRDLEEIQKYGVIPFRKFFWDSKVIFGWKSIITHFDGKVHVPCLVEGLDRLVILWYKLEEGWNRIPQVWLFPD